MVKQILTQSIRSLNGIVVLALIGSCGMAYARNCTEPESGSHPVYDSNGRIIATSDAQGGKTTYTYDKAGNLIACSDPKGVVTQFQYDINGRRIKETIASVTTEAR